MYEVNLTVNPDEKLIVFLDVTEEVQYGRFKFELVENISHELKTPLAMVQGYAETILNDPQMEAETLARFLQKIFNGSKRINGIINDLLELHKLESIGRRVHLEAPTLVADVMQDIINRFAEVQTPKIVYDIRTLNVHIHHEHLFSILSNLIDNAVKYSGGKKIFVSLIKMGTVIEIQVEDEGAMIEESERERIFERFYTISRSRSHIRSGTGLGLPIVKHIAQLYRGNVALFESRHGGNNFTVTLHEQPEDTPSTVQH